MGRRTCCRADAFVDAVCGAFDALVHGAYALTYALLGRVVGGAGGLLSGVGCILGGAGALLLSFMGCVGSVVHCTGGLLDGFVGC